MNNQYCRRSVSSLCLLPSIVVPLDTPQCKIWHQASEFGTEQLVLATSVLSFLFDQERSWR
jgi:hypothetical protein